MMPNSFESEESTLRIVSFETEPDPTKSYSHPHNYIAFSPEFLASVADAEEAMKAAALEGEAGTVKVVDKKFTQDTEEEIAIFDGPSALRLSVLHEAVMRELEARGATLLKKTSIDRRPHMIVRKYHPVQPIHTFSVERFELISIMRLTRMFHTHILSSVGLKGADLNNNKP